MAFCSKQEYRHIQDVQYLEYTLVLAMKCQVTLDGFNFVSTKYGSYDLRILCLYAVLYVRS